MRIEKTKEVLSHIGYHQMLFHWKQNVSKFIVSPLLSSPVNTSYFSKERKEKVFENNPAIASLVDENVDHGYFFYLIASLLSQTAKEKGVSPNEIILPDSFLVEMAKNSRFYRKSDLEKDPYFSNISLKGSKKGRFSIGEGFYNRGDLSILGFIPAKEPSILLPTFSFFEDDISFPTLWEGQYLWMSITPSEIESMKPHLEKARGNILVLGCGLGYFPYLASLKEEVKRITIVEKSPEIIELFEERILPQFGEYEEKIEIFQFDAFDYPYFLPDGVFDYCFVDLWLSAQEIGGYLAARKACSGFEEMEAEYWIEDALIDSIRNYIYIVLFEEAFPDRIFQKRKKPNTSAEFGEYRTFLRTEQLLEKVVIEKPEDIDLILSKEGILALLDQTVFDV